MGPILPLLKFPNEPAFHNIHRLLHLYIMKGPILPLLKSPSKPALQNIRRLLHLYIMKVNYFLNIFYVLYFIGAFAGEGGLDDVATGSTTLNSTGAFVGEGGLDDLGTGSTTPNSTVENLRWLPTSVSRSPNFLVNQSGKRRGARNRRVPARLGSTDYIRISSLMQDVQTTPSPTGPSSLLVHEGTTPPRFEGEARSFDVFSSDFIRKHTNGLVSWKHL
ncbi:hypothetical protein LOK49_LG03G02570 [Camellia lanceoleosa]|uniref:Uncharacterized protein n=1 Tax=Camellia lanceoleosa TaxID=1840588 RepID=A0ACC0I7M9_9ERIC|nr:hypothetical protein LOK49_LG03G02570 [Camellia lanceoleosa]